MISANKLVEQTSTDEQINPLRHVERRVSEWYVSGNVLTGDAHWTAR